MQPSILFNWKAPQDRVDGSVMTPEEIDALTYDLYLGDIVIVSDIGKLNFTLLMEDEEHGRKSFSVAAKSYGLSGPRSEPTVVNFIPPAAPTNLTAEWIAGSANSESGPSA
jgi:hypothetical protein